MGREQAAGRLVIVGGGEERPGEILREFVRLAGGPGARIAVMAAASREPEEYERLYCDAFSRIGAGEVLCLRATGRDEADLADAVRALDGATGVFFTGGDQRRLADRLRETGFHEALRRRYAEGLVIGGTSAGASVLSATMLVEGESEESPRPDAVTLGPGLGLLDGAIIDQHFAQRGRLGRLLSALARRPQDLGLGIDEDTAVIVSGPQIEVIGRGSVLVLDGRALTHNSAGASGPDGPLTICGVTLHCLSSGSGFDLTARMPTGRPDPSSDRPA